MAGRVECEELRAVFKELAERYPVPEERQNEQQPQSEEVRGHPPMDLDAQSECNPEGDCAGKVATEDVGSGDKRVNATQRHCASARPKKRLRNTAQAATAVPKAVCDRQGTDQEV
jgi:hypothetical protein